MARLNFYSLFAFALGKFITASPLLLREIAATVPSNVAPGTVTAGCAAFHTVASGETCLAIEAAFNISDALFHTLNPEVNSGCTNLIAGEAYCVQNSNSTTTVPPNVAQGTITAGCTQFVTLQPGDTCSSIETAFNISNALFVLFNPEINNVCTNLIAGEAYCVQSSNSTITLPAQPSNVAPGTITAGCTTFFTVQSGDTCQTIEDQFNITSATLVSLNPELNAACTNLLLGEAYCVRSNTTTS